MPRKQTEDRKPPEHPLLPDAFALPEEPRRSQHVNRCSSICHPCPYFGYQARARWEDRSPWSEDFQRIFKAGRKVEAETTAALLERGLDIQRSQEELAWPERQLYGHMDGVVPVGSVVELMDKDGVYVPDAIRADPRALVVWDVKSQDPAVYGRYGSIEDLLAPLSGPSVYRWQYPGQLTLYGTHERVGAKWCCMYFVNRSNYQTLQAWWRIDHPLAQREVQSALNACRWINDAIARGPDADPQEIADALARPGRWCEACAFRHVCERWLLTGNEIHVKLELSELVDRREHNREIKTRVVKDYDEANNRLKDVWRAHQEEHGDGEVLVGDYMVRLKKDKRGTVRAIYKPTRRKA